MDVLIATGRLKQDEQVPAAPRGPIPKDATVKEKMARRLRTKKGKADYARRKAIVEPVFGQVKVRQPLVSSAYAALRVPKVSGPCTRCATTCESWPGRACRKAQMGRQAIERNLTMGSESPSAALGPVGKARTDILRRQPGPIDRFGPTLLGQNPHTSARILLEWRFVEGAAAQIKSICDCLSRRDCEALRREGGCPPRCIAHFEDRASESTVILGAFASVCSTTQ